MQRENDSLQVESIGFLLTSQLQLAASNDPRSSNTTEYITEEEELALRKKTHFDFDLEILSVVALTYEEEEKRINDSRKEYLRQKNKHDSSLRR